MRAEHDRIEGDECGVAHDDPSEMGGATELEEETVKPEYEDSADEGEMCSTTTIWKWLTVRLLDCYSLNDRHRTSAE